MCTLDISGIIHALIMKILVLKGLEHIILVFVCIARDDRSRELNKVQTPGLKQKYTHRLYGYCLGVGWKREINFLSNVLIKIFHYSSICNLHPIPHSESHII